MQKYKKHLVIALSILNAFSGVLLFYKSSLGINFLIINIIFTSIITFLAKVYKRLNFSLVINNILLILISTSFCITSSNIIRTIIFLSWIYLMLLNMHVLVKKNHEFAFFRYISIPIEQSVMSFISPIFSIFSIKLQRKSNITRIMIRVAAGTIIAIPFLLILTILLISGDLVFRGYFQDIFHGYFMKDAISIVFWFLLALWITFGIIYYNLYKKDKQAVLGKNIKVKRPKLFIESITILSLVELLFLIYNIVQITYMFGGEKHIKADGFTYSEYARSGFFELIAASIIAIILIGTLFKFTEAKDKVQGIILRVVSIFGLAELLPMLISAFYRLYMYEEAYSFTTLRVYSHLFIIYLTLILIIFAIKFSTRIKEKTFIYTIQIITYTCMIIIGFLNVDSYIVKANIERYKDGKTSENIFDIGYFYLLSYDSIPAQIDYFKSTNGVNKQEIAYYLESKYIELEFEEKRGNDIREFNFRKSLAKRLLDDNIDEIRKYSDFYEDKIWELYKENLSLHDNELSHENNHTLAENDVYDYCSYNVEFNYINKYGEEDWYSTIKLYDYENPNEIVIDKSNGMCVDVPDGKYFVLATNAYFTFEITDAEMFVIEIKNFNDNIYLYKRYLSELRIE